MDLAKAVRSNPHFARSLGWDSRYAQIAQLLNFSASSPGPEQFAIAVEQWQRMHPPLDLDGMIGPRTWRVMEPLTRFNAVPASPPPWMSGGGHVVVATDSLFEIELAPRPPRPPQHARVSMRRGGIRHRSYEELFAPAEMALHRESLEMLSAARTLGRSHATMEWLAQNPPMPPNPMEGAGDVQGYARLDEARRDGAIVATTGGRHRYRSNVLRSAEFRQLAERYGVWFLNEFDQAAHQQRQYMRTARVVDAVSLIADLLLTWGLSAVARRAAIAAGTIAAVEAVGSSIAAVYRRVLAKCREFLIRITTRRREVLRSIVRRESSQGEHLATDTLVDLSDTLPAPPRQGGSIDVFADTHPELPRTRPGTGVNPSVSRRAPPSEPSPRPHVPHPIPELERLRDPRNVFEELTEAEAIERIRPVRVPSGSRWASGGQGYMNYAAEWEATGGPLQGSVIPPQWGFRIRSPQGEVLHICSYVRDPSRLSQVYGPAW